MIEPDPMDAKRTGNPLFNENRLKLGLFSFNGKGQQLSKLPGPDVTWSRSRTLAQKAEQIGFEAIVPYSRWKGRPQDAATRHEPHDVFDPYTWAAGLSEATERPAVFSTTHVPMIHPIVAAKLSATIDHISGGRFALNVVAGWNAPEFEMFGSPLKSHDDRYAQAVEWIEIVRRLWTQEDEFDFEGAYYKIVKGESFPKPLQTPFPPIMSAGGSDKGAHFAAKYADLCFVWLSNDDPAAIRAQVDAYRKLAWEEYRREVKVWTVCPSAVRPTQQEADDFQQYLRDNLDPANIRQLAAIHGQNSKPMTIDGKLGKAPTPTPQLALAGSPERVVERLQMMSAAGIDGVLISSEQTPDLELDIWGAQVIPLLEQAGLRKTTAA